MTEKTFPFHISDSPRFACDQLHNMALHLMHVGNTSGAMQRLDEAIALDPTYGAAFALKALCLIRQGKRSEAVRAAKEALALEPNSPHSINSMAAVRMDQKRYNESENYFKQLLAVAPTTAIYYRNFALLYTAMRKRKNALRMLEKATELDPTDPQIRAELATQYFFANKMAQARRLAEEAVRLGPENAAALVIRGRVALLDGDIQTAREHSVWALRAKADDAEAIHLLVSLKARQSLFLGLWWRFSLFSSGSIFSWRGLSAVAFVLSICAAAAATEKSSGVGIPWPLWIIYAFIAYRAIASRLFRRMLAKEIAKVKLKGTF